MATYERRKRKDGRYSWRAIVRIQDPRTRKKVLRKKTFDRKTDAKEWAETLERRIREGETPERDRKVSDLIDGWLEEGLPSIKGAKERRSRRRQVEWWRERIGHLRVSQVSPAMIHSELLSRDCSNARRNRWKSALGTIYRYWVKRGELRRADNPTEGLHWREPKGRVRWLDDDERAALLAAVADDPRLDLIVRVALTTGMRRGEIISLTWRDCDFEREVFRIEDTKSGTPRTVAMLPGVRERLEALRAESSSELVFPGKTGKPSFPVKPWREAVAKAQLEGFRFHDLRHTFASYLAMQGATLRELAETLGHQTLAMVKRYSHLRPDVVIESVRERAAGLERWIDEEPTSRAEPVSESMAYRGTDASSVSYDLVISPSDATTSDVGFEVTTSTMTPADAWLWEGKKRELGQRG